MKKILILLLFPLMMFAQDSTLIGDVDCSGEVNSQDASLILQFVTNVIDEPSKTKREYKWYNQDEDGCTGNFLQKLFCKYSWFRWGGAIVLIFIFVSAVYNRN